MLKKAEERKLVQVLMFLLNSVINLTLRVILVFKDSSEDPMNSLPYHLLINRQMRHSLGSSPAVQKVQWLCGLPSTCFLGWTADVSWTSCWT